MNQMELLKNRIWHGLTRHILRRSSKLGYLQKVRFVDSKIVAERWDIEKKMSKKVDNLKLKLLQKVCLILVFPFTMQTKDLSSSEKTIISLRSTLERIERDRTRLQAKVASLASLIGQTPVINPVHASSKKEEISPPANVENGKEKRISELESQITSLEKDLKIKQNQDLLLSGQKISQLQERVKILEGLNTKLQLRITAFEYQAEAALNSEGGEVPVKDEAKENAVELEKKLCEFMVFFVIR